MSTNNKFIESSVENTFCVQTASRYVALRVAEIAPRHKDGLKFNYTCYLLMCTVSININLAFVLAKIFYRRYRNTNYAIELKMRYQTLNSPDWASSNLIFRKTEDQKAVSSLCLPDTPNS